MTTSSIYMKYSPAPWNHFGSSGDGLLFACLLAVGQNVEFPVEDAIDLSTGQVFRNPEFRTGRVLGPRESTISRDMFMGLFIYCLHFRRVDLIRKVISYGWKHFWKMGTENRKLDISFLGRKSQILADNRTIFTPGLILLIYALLAQLTGKTWVARMLVSIPQPMSSSPGYVSHLSMLHIYLNKRICGKLSTSDKSTLIKISSHMESNPLVWALLGNPMRALACLNRWPQTRLPTKEDWSEEWRTQRSDGDSGLTGISGNTSPHSGGDYLFVKHCMEAL